MICLFARTIITLHQQKYGWINNNFANEKKYTFLRENFFLPPQTMWHLNIMYLFSNYDRKWALKITFSTEFSIVFGLGQM